MITISRDALGKSSQEFIRDVLIENLTDVQSPVRANSTWIFKSTEDETRIKGKLPRVYIEQASEDRTRLAPNVTGPIMITFDITIWDSGDSDVNYRDQVADEVIKVLASDTSTDGTNSLKSQHLYYESSTQSNEDALVEDVSLRIKRISINMHYRGW